MKTRLIAFILGCLALTACKRGFEPVKYGKDACADCRMTIVDPQYATEIIDEKGKVFKFDDIICMLHYAREHKENLGNKLVFVAASVNGKSTFIDGKTAVYMKHERFRSPMGGNYRAFLSVNDAKAEQEAASAAIVTLDEL